ncbi:Metalloprotease PmbA like protein [Saliniradius amylolyticus]|uniref:Metalloprotease PmbA like protein n=1 Tax=Saliniradius amylolyticus TaxID=2183582 RepID=A0A2S2DZH5_9ALTE|nr:metalloprotease PmbA [Saliniradius amylolyticus]AWL10804.1 Metalloprotease PmbA like protein [Saliniradius amylolyticus]
MQAQQTLSEIQNVVSDVLSLAKQKGATAAEASMSKVQGISVGSRLRQIETLEFTNDGGLGITVYVGQRKGSASTADLRPEALQQTVAKAVEIARYTSEDPCTGLADKAMIATDIPDLNLYHPQELDAEQAIAQAIAAEEAAFAADDRIVNSDGAAFNANLGVKVYGNTHGINAGYPSSRYSLSCVVIGKDGDDMQRDYSYTLSRKAGELLTPEQIGQEAARHTLSRLGSRKAKTDKVPVIFHHDLAPALFGHFVAAISGGSLYRNSSFLLDHKGKQVLPSWLNISERPHLTAGLASSPFDYEGVRTRDMEIVTDGILQDYLLTSYSARKLGLQTNGHAGGIHNWLVTDTGDSLDALVKKMGRGLLVTELMGQGVNIVNGDYSRGAAGFWVENGEIQYPVHEVTIAGNLKQMLMGIQAIGTDTETRGSIATGSVLIDQMQVAGN